MATITKRGNSFNIRVSAGYDLNGKQIRKNLTWTPLPGMTAKQIEKELNIQAVKFEEKVQTGIVINGSIKFSEFADKWVEDYARTQLAPKTVHRYEGLLTRINLAIGHIRLDKLQPVHLNDFYNNLSEIGIRKDIKYKIMKDKVSKLVKANGSKINIINKSSLSKSTVYSMLKGVPIDYKTMNILCESIKINSSNYFCPVNKRPTLSPLTIHHHHRLVCTILEAAVQWQIVSSNSAKKVKAPRARIKESKYLDEVQTKDLLKILDNENIQMRTMITMLVYTGLRRGELCGLKWKDINFKNQTLDVKRSLQYIPKQGIIVKEPKNETSFRSIKISGILVVLLEKYKAWQNKEKLKLGDLWQKEERIKNPYIDLNYIFTGWNGSLIYPDYLTKWFRNFIKRNNLPLVNIHSLRHTNATLMIAGGTDIRTVSKRLGHAQTSTTTNIYAHAIRSADESAADTLENILIVGQKGNSSSKIIQ